MMYTIWWWKDYVSKSQTTFQCTRLAFLFKQRGTDFQLPGDTLSTSNLYETSYFNLHQNYRNK